MLRHKLNAGSAEFLPDKTTYFESEKQHNIILHRKIKPCLTEASREAGEGRRGKKGKGERKIFWKIALQ
jgi:hypothetical protein